MIAFYIVFLNIFIFFKVICNNFVFGRNRIAEEKHPNHE